MVKAITARNNICTVQSYHTYSAVVLRPPINGTDNQMPQVSAASFDIRRHAKKHSTSFAADAHLTWSVDGAFEGIFDKCARLSRMTLRRSRRWTFGPRRLQAVSPHIIMGLHS